MKRLLIIIAVVISVTLTVFSSIHDGLKFKRIGVSEGLSHATISDIGQDSQGYIWIATPDGLNRYDGYGFMTYRHEFDNPNSLPSNLISAIDFDREGNMWVAGGRYLSEYDFSTERFTNYTLDDDVTITDLVPLEGDILVGTTGGLYTFNPQEGTFSKGYAKREMTTPVVSMNKTGDDIYIAAGFNGLYHLNLRSQTLHKLPLPTKGNVRGVLRDGETLYVATEGDGLFSLHLPSGNLTAHYTSGGREGLGSNYVRSLALDSRGRLWVGTFRGLDIFDPERNTFIHYDTATDNAETISHNSVRRIFADNTGGMWLGTFFGGLNYYHPLRNQFQTLRHSPLHPSLNDDVVGAIVEDTDGSLWIATNTGGLNLYNPETGAYRYFTMADGLGSNDVKAMFIDGPAGKVYVGSHLGGLNIIDRNTGRITSGGETPQNIYSILPSRREGSLWLATLDHLVIYDKRSKKSHAIGSNGLKRITDLYRDARGRLWVSGEDGVTAFYEDSEGNLNVSTEIPAEINSYRKAVNNVYQSRDGRNFYISTNEGIIRYDSSTGAVSHITSRHGLPNDIVYGVLEDADGDLWCSTNGGIGVLNPATGGIRVYTAHDGLQSNQFNHKSFLRSKSGYMYFGGINGLTYFNPSSLQSNPYTPSPVISRLRLFNKTVTPGDDTGILKRSITETPKITLGPDQTVFTIDFTVCNYVAGGHNTFSYKLEGLDAQWTSADEAGSVTYSNLPPGKYKFLLRAANNDGITGGDLTTLEIEILPRWYNRWWARLIFTLIVIAAIALIIIYLARRRVRRERDRLEKVDRERQNELNEMKVRFFINMSHELRTPLTLILLPVRELLQKVVDKKTSQKLTLVKNNAERILHIVNQLLDYRKAEMGMFKLQTEPVNVNNLIRKIFANFEYQAASKGIVYRLDRTLPDSEVTCDPQYIEVICNNLISNAFKYTPKGQTIHVAVDSGLSRENPEIIITVADTGCGIPPDKLQQIFTRFYMVDGRASGSGIGLSLVKRLVDLHHGTIRVESELGKGTIFTVTIPVGENEYAETEKRDLENVEGADTMEDALYIPEMQHDNESADIEDVKEDTEKDTILVVDDNPDILKYICDGLAEEFNVVPATDGAKALEILGSQSVSLILTDIMMPDIDGIQLCRSIKRNLRTSHIPVIMLSAKSDVADQIGGLKVGADDYIPKPFSMEILTSKIRNQLRTRRLAIRHFAESEELKPERLAFNPLDEEFLKKAMTVMERHLDDSEFTTDMFAGEMCMSRSNLHLKMKALTGESTNEFIRRFRMNRALELLKSGAYNISQVSMMVGYGTPSYFTTTFKKFFGALPSEYIKDPG